MVKSYFSILADFFNLHIIQFYRCGSSEDLHGNFQFLLLVVYFFDYAVEIVEWSFDDLDGLANDERFAHA